MNSRRLARRGFLAAVASSATCLPLRSEAAASVPLARQLSSIPRDRESALAVGEAYLQTQPDEADVEVLTRLIVAELGWPVGSSRDGWKKAIGEQVREDFHRERTVRVKGWMLSQTESRLCALCWLLR